MAIVRVQREDFDVGRELESLTGGRSGVGAVASFIGHVRAEAGGEAVLGLELEHYPGMTERALEEICREAHARWPLVETLVIHRVGPLRAGERIVLVGVASAHRAAAFEACEFIMDYLKTRAPFWKREKTTSGERWVESRSSDGEAADRWR
jgi:molybdopterin synthase catalytic subunit